ncbi:MAG: RNA 3'-terminal phosphate cyclase [Spirochaetales bacterium]|nr:RNA 3'-terminal phosphate cyclase [Spirochaetales bacterium]
MIFIDGSFGEGGGQILRTALGLSLVTGKPFNIKNIRSGRKKPGLLRQHLTAVNAAGEIGKAVVKGNSIGSGELYFEPHSVSPGEYNCQVGTAGSATLVLQTVLPALLSCKSASKLVLEGGTHNPYAPPFDFLNYCFLPCLSKMGVQIKCSLVKYGFYPAGGGEFEIDINPARPLKPFIIREREGLKRTSVLGIVSDIPFHIAEDEVKIVCSEMGWDENTGKAISVHSSGPGNIVLAILEYGNITEVITGFGQRGLPLKKVAENVVKQVKKYMESDAPVGEYLADQLLVPMALTGQGSFCTNSVSKHTLTNSEIIKKFLNVRIQYEKKGENIFEINIQGGRYEVGEE